ncbi:MAG TPA: hypothetical protein VFY89_01190 [Ktedonobacterales bacterium]
MDHHQPSPGAPSQRDVADTPAPAANLSVVARPAAPSSATSDPTAREMPCPQCGHPMPDLKGGKDSLCPICGFKDSCCY